MEAYIGRQRISAAFTFHSRVSLAPIMQADHLDRESAAPYRLGINKGGKKQ